MKNLCCKSIFVTVFFSFIAMSCSTEFPEKCTNSTECPGSRICYGGRCVSFGSNSRLQTPRKSPQRLTDTKAEAIDTASSCAANYSGSRPSLRLNEILANVPEGKIGDANRDGERDPYADEFIEITNQTSESVALGNLTLKINQDKLTLGASKSCLDAGKTLVVFGGGKLSSFRNSVPSVRVISPGSALRLSNSGATVELLWNGQRIDSMSYDTAPLESLTLKNQHGGANYVLHTDVSNDKRFSPGKCPNGDKFKKSTCR